ncbi:unnamed protein product [marine sediment metagenome]|uniref:TACO1/YebC-like second and third domain-containing protein n=1 Tax=marine sediment metagenome TaxID=412755 RepID=X0TGW5_9ZZZZ
MIVVEQLPQDLDRDEFLMSLIELGAEEFDDQEDVIEIYCAPADLAALSEGIKKAGVVPSRTEATMVPQNTARVDGRAAEKVIKLINELDDNEDVQEVFANFDIPDEILIKINSE